MAKNPDIDDILACAIAARYVYDPNIKIKLDKDVISNLGGEVMELSKQIFERHEIQKGEQPEKIADALMECKEQMLVRDNFKPEYIIMEYALTADDETFGFLNQSKKNRLTKFGTDLFFTSASSLFYDYFKSRVSVVSTEISGLSRKRIDANQ